MKKSESIFTNRKTVFRRKLCTVPTGVNNTSQIYQRYFKKKHLQNLPTSSECFSVLLFDRLWEKILLKKKKL